MSSINIIMTAGDPGTGSTARGFEEPGGVFVGTPFGSLSSNVVNGSTVADFFVSGVTPNFGLEVTFNGALPKTQWTSVSFVDNVGTPHTFNSANASPFHSNIPAGFTQWGFNGVSSQLFTSGNLYTLTFTFPDPPIPPIIQLTWQPPVITQYPVGAYRIFRSVNSSNGPFVAIATVQGLTYLDINVSSGNTYFYEIISIDSQGHLSTNSNILSNTL